MSVISDMSTEQETEVFSPDFVSAGRYRGGPHGVGQIFHKEDLFIYKEKRIFSCLGDPNDKTLRKVEIEVCIPGIVRERAHREKCHQLINGKTNQIRKKEVFISDEILIQNLANVVNNMEHGLFLNVEKKSKQ